jgi:hypothetical protein
MVHGLRSIGSLSIIQDFQVGGRDFLVREKATMGLLVKIAQF